MEANTYELNLGIIHMIQYQMTFGVSHIDDPNAHLEGLLSICDTIKFNGVNMDSIRLGPFSFFLHG